jgi:two-component system OmpR family response regulator
MYGVVAGEERRLSPLCRFRNGDGVQLTAREFKLLAFLLQNAKRVISRKELLDAIWGCHTDPATRTVDVHISKLRQKVETDLAPDAILPEASSK